MKDQPPARPMPFDAALQELTSVLAASSGLAAGLGHSARAIIASLRAGGKVLTCGNGGSAADALHLAEEFVGRYRHERRPLPALCLGADAATLTCVANDYGFERIFSRGVEAFGRRGDVLVAFSTSGNSRNVVAAIESARGLGLVTILLSGREGGKARALCDHALVVPSDSVERIQEVHSFLIHQLLEAVDAESWT